MVQEWEQVEHDVMACDGVTTVKLHVAHVIGLSDRRGWVVGEKGYDHILDLPLGDRS